MQLNAHRPESRGRARKPAATMLTAAALGLVLTSCSSSAEVAPDTPTPEPPAGTPTDSATPAQTDGATGSTSPADGSALLDGSRQVDVQTYGDLWLTTTVEGGLATVAERDASEVPTTWFIETVTGQGAADDPRYLLRSTATTDGRDFCLNAPGDGVLGLAVCDESVTTQHLDIGSTDRPNEVNISTGDGYLVAEPDGGLALAPDPASPATVFSLIDQGPA